MTSDINSLFTSIQSTLFLLKLAPSVQKVDQEALSKFTTTGPAISKYSWNSHQTEAENSPDSPCSSKICFYLILLVISILKHKGWNPSYLSCDWLTKNSVRGQELPARASLRREATSEVFSLSVFSSVVMSFSSFSFPLATLSMPSSTVSLLIRRTTDTSLVCPTR